MTSRAGETWTPRPSHPRRTTAPPSKTPFPAYDEQVARFFALKRSSNFSHPISSTERIDQRRCLSERGLGLAV